MRKYLTIFLMGMAGLFFLGNSLAADKPTGSLTYKFIEAENTATPLANKCIRETGFTWFMGTPSGGKVVVFGAPWNYAVKDLPAGVYNIWIRQLNWRSAKDEGKTANTEVKINGQRIGETYYVPQLGWALRWSSVGQAKLDGNPLVLNINLTADNAQAPYIDVILLTDDLNYMPEFADQDFKSFQGIDKHIKLHGAVLDGAGKNAALRVSLHSPDDFTACQAEARFCDELKRSLLVFKTVCDIKKGKNGLLIPISGLEQGSYPVRVQIMSPDSQTMIASADFTVEAAQAWQATLENHYLLQTETLCRIKVSVTGSNLAARAKSARLSIVNGDKKLGEKDYPLNSPVTDLTYEATSLTPGKYEVRIDLLDEKARTLESSAFPLIKTRRTGDIPKLKPARKTEIINDLIMVNGKYFVPRKLFHANAEPKFARQGYNAVDCYGNPEAIKHMLDEAARNDMYGYAVLFDSYFYDGKNKNFNLERIKECVGKLKEHPALFCWLLFDEPEGVLVKADDMMAAANVIREADPNHPVQILYYQPDVLPKYVGCSDLSGFNVYPVPNMPLTMVSQGLDALRESIESRQCRAMEISMQAYGNPATRMPTPDEYRAMLYMAINHGARSFADYSWNEGKNYKLCLEHDNLLWSYMKIINREILTLAKMISCGQALNSAAKCTNEQIDWSLRKANGEIYLIAVNTSSNKTVADFTLPPGFAKAAQEVFNQEEFVINSGNLRLDFNSYQARILKFKKWWFVRIFRW